MKRARFTDEQIIGMLKEHEAGAKTADLACKHGVSEGTLYNWKAKYGGMDALNAFAALNPRALDEARELDRKFAETGVLVGPLHGVPIAAKDQAETAGIPTCFGSIALKGYVPTEDATIMAELKEAGAIIIGKTTLPDFATSWFGYSSATGETRNPYDLARDPGGSSAGTGAAIAANAVSAALNEIQKSGGQTELMKKWSLPEDQMEAPKLVIAD